MVASEFSDVLPLSNVPSMSTKQVGNGSQYRIESGPAVVTEDILASVTTSRRLSNSKGNTPEKVEADAETINFGKRKYCDKSSQTMCTILTYDQNDDTIDLELTVESEPVQKISKMSATSKIEVFNSNSKMATPESAQMRRRPLSTACSLPSYKDTKGLVKVGAVAVLRPIVDISPLGQQKFLDVHNNLRRYPERFFHCMHMTVETFDLLVKLVRPVYRTAYDFSYPIEQLVAITLRFLITGDPLSMADRKSGMSMNMVWGTIINMASTLTKVLEKDYMATLTTNMWLSRAKDFYKKNGFPNVLGFLDAFHTRVKRGHGEVIMLVQAIVDEKTRILVVDCSVGTTSCSGSTPIAMPRTSMITSKWVQFPEYIPVLSSSGRRVPYVVLPLKKCPLHRKILTPYENAQDDFEKTLYNAHLKKAIRSADSNLEALLCQKKFMNDTSLWEVANTVILMKFTCVLHNFVLAQDGLDKMKTLIRQVKRSVGELPAIKHKTTSQDELSRILFTQHFVETFKRKMKGVK